MWNSNSYKACRQHTYHGEGERQGGEVVEGGGVGLAVADRQSSHRGNERLLISALTPSHALKI